MLSDQEIITKSIEYDYMREVKFRFYHQKTGYLYEDTGITSLGVNDGIKLAQDSGYKMMQYTGFKDSNGQEIYEGDFLQKDDGKTNHTIGVVEVRWHGAGFGIFIGNKYQGWLGRDVADYSVVVGNIYERS